MPHASAARRLLRCRLSAAMATGAPDTAPALVPRTRGMKRLAARRIRRPLRNCRREGRCGPQCPRTTGPAQACCPWVPRAAPHREAVGAPAGAQGGALMRAPPAPRPVHRTSPAAVVSFFAVASCCCGLRKPRQGPRGYSGLVAQRSRGNDKRTEARKPVAMIIRARLRLTQAIRQRPPLATRPPRARAAACPYCRPPPLPSPPLPRAQRPPAPPRPGPGAACRAPTR